MKIYIWGTGKIADTIYTNGINGDLQGFIETRKSKREYKGFSVYETGDIKKNNYDYIIVANSHTDAIYHLCAEQGIDLNKMIFIERGSCATFHSCPEVKEILGEKNYAIYAGNYGRLEGTFFEEDLKKYKKMNKREAFCISEEHLRPILFDKYAVNTGFDSYFWMDLWAAKHIISSGIKEHYDVGSRVDGFIAHLLAAGLKVNMIDVRPFSGEAKNLYTIIDDATMMRQFKDNSLQSLSALCSPEHFGLGRYGDPVDPEACFQFFEKVQQKLKPGGRAYIAVPVGQDRVEFNAHRVFYANTVISCLSKLRLVEFSAVDEGKIFYNEDVQKYDNRSEGHVVGLFCFEKPMGDINV